MVKKLKTIRSHTDAELDAAIETAIQACPEFYKILHGVDAYVERRRRRYAAREAAFHRAAMDDITRDEAWGDE